MNSNRFTKIGIMVLIVAVMAYAQQPVNVNNIPHVVVDTAPTTAVSESGTWSVRAQDGGGNALTSNSTTYTAKFGLDTNLLGTLGTAFTTAGFVDIKGADGNVFVRQATGTNLHAVIDTGSTTAVTQATGSNLHAVLDANASVVIGKVAIDQTTPGTTNAVSFAAGNTIALVPVATGGLLMSHTITAGTDNAALVSTAAAHQLYEVDVFNNAAYPVYVKLYNVAASPTGCGSTGLVKVLGVQAGTGRTLAEPIGLAFGSGIGMCVTKGITNADDTATVASDATVDVAWK
jgi:hypothetical protein